MIAEAGGAVHWLQRGGTRLRIASWPEGASGVVLLLHGRTEYIEKYLETVAALQARGFGVWTLDWRGQGLSDRALRDAAAHHVDDFEDYLADLDAVLDRFVAPALDGRALVLLGHSMGGHLAARALARRPRAFSRAVLLAPMIDFRHGSLPRWLARVIAGGVCRVPGGAARYGPGRAGRLGAERVFEGNVLTSDAARYAAGRALLDALPDMRLGGVTWGWIRAAMASIAALRRAAPRIAVPVLVALAGDERVVDNAAICRFAGLVPQAELLVLEGARHELLQEHDEVRTRLWAAIDAFLQA